MTARGQYLASVRRCTPVGSIDAEPSAVAAAIRKRLDNPARGSCAWLTVFVDGGLVYATRVSSPISAVVGAQQIVGVYTHLAAANDIAEDIEAWARAAA